MTLFYNKSAASAVTQTAQVLLPMIRRVMPNIIANNIIGVQPMTGPTVDIFNTKYNLNRDFNWAGRVRMYKEHYNHFLRVYNRRKTHHPDYLTNLGYNKARVSFSNAIAADQWCRKTFKTGTYVRSSADFWFARDKDYTLFTLRWNNDSMG
jgi:hypothetical protein